MQSICSIISCHRASLPTNSIWTDITMPWRPLCKKIPVQARKWWSSCLTGCNRTQSISNTLRHHLKKNRIRQRAKSSCSRTRWVAAREINYANLTVPMTTSMKIKTLMIATKRVPRRCLTRTPILQWSKASTPSPSCITTLVSAPIETSRLISLLAIRQTAEVMTRIQMLRLTESKMKSKRYLRFLRTLSTDIPTACLELHSLLLNRSPFAKSKTKSLSLHISPKPEKPQMVITRRTRTTFSSSRTSRRLKIFGTLVFATDMVKMATWSVSMLKTSLLLTSWRLIFLTKNNKRWEWPKPSCLATTTAKILRTATVLIPPITCQSQVTLSTRENKVMMGQKETTMNLVTAWQAAPIGDSAISGRVRMSGLLR